MNIKYLGTTYGGWVIDLDSVNDGDVIIGGGVGEDISFEEELLKHKNVKIIGVDPTEKSNIFLNNKQNPNIELLRCAIEKDGVDEITLYKNTNPEYVSDSVNKNHNSVGSIEYRQKCISIKTLIEKYNPSLIKIDIEGSEYNVYKECIGVKQVCIEFHHHCITDKTLEDTLNIIKEFEDNGYKVIDNRNNIEMTFLKRVDENIYTSLNQLDQNAIEKLN